MSEISGLSFDSIFLSVLLLFWLVLLLLLSSSFSGFGPVSCLIHDDNDDDDDDDGNDDDDDDDDNDDGVVLYMYISTITPCYCSMLSALGSVVSFEACCQVYKSQDTTLLFKFIVLKYINFIILSVKCMLGLP